MIPLHITLGNTVQSLCRLHFNGCWGLGDRISHELQFRENKGMCVSSKSKRKDSDNRLLQFQALVISKSWGRGALPKAGETQLGLEARTFSQFISLKLGAVPNGRAPTSIIWSLCPQPGFHFPNRIQISSGTNKQQI